MGSTGHHQFLCCISAVLVYLALSLIKIHYGKAKLSVQYNRHVETIPNWAFLNTSINHCASFILQSYQLLLLFFNLIFCRASPWSVFVKLLNWLKGCVQIATWHAHKMHWWPCHITQIKGNGITQSLSSVRKIQVINAPSMANEFPWRRSTIRLLMCVFLLGLVLYLCIWNAHRYGNVEDG